MKQKWLNKMDFISIYSTEKKIRKLIVTLWKNEIYISCFKLKPIVIFIVCYWIVLGLSSLKIKCYPP